MLETTAKIEVRTSLAARLINTESYDADFAYFEHGTLIHLNKGERIVLECATEGSYPLVDCGDVNMFTTKGLYRGSKATMEYANYADGLDYNTSVDDFARIQESANISLRARYPILRHLNEADAHTWWVVQLRYMYYDQCFLINFERREFWHKYLGNVICVWNDIDDGWNPQDWGLAKLSLGDGSRRRTSEVMNGGEDGQGEAMNDGVQSVSFERPESGTMEEDNDESDQDSLFGDNSNPWRGDRETKIIDHSDSLFQTLSCAFK